MILTLGRFLSAFARQSSTQPSLNIKVGPCHFQATFGLGQSEFGLLWSLYIQFSKLLWILGFSNPTDFCKSKFLYFEGKFVGRH